MKLIKSLIPSDLEDNPLFLRKVKVLIYVVLFFLTIVSILLILNCVIKDKNEATIWPAFLFGFLLLFILKKKSNIVITGNLFAFFWMLMLGVYVPQTGGLHSDNLLWLIISPLIALLFSNKKWGIAWLMALIVFTIGLYFHQNSTNQLMNLDKSYYLISYVFLFITIFITVLIFEHGQTLIIKLLENQKQTLQAQKQELEQKNQEILEQKLQLEKMSEKLKETNLALEHFAATAAHDLREPLRMISMYTSMSQRRMSNHPDSIRDEYMGFVTNGVSRMNKLLTNLLEFSRSGRNDNDIKDVDLNTSIHDVILNLTVVLKETGSCVIIERLPTIHVSESAMSQLFQNLIANAIKFRKDNVPAEVLISYLNRKDTHVLTIKDNGIGIKKEHQTKVFNIFERLNGRDKYDGSGIGLATCRKIVENLNGKIWLRSSEGVGTTFYIAFPKNHNYVMINEEELEFA
jgi:signal transduction histidine kinase